jgi:Tol biopolymer transport system component
MKRFLLGAIILILALAACQPVETAPVNSPTDSSSPQTRTPSSSGANYRLTDTITPIGSTPSITPILPTKLMPSMTKPLASEGPYFTYFRGQGNHLSLVMADADGVGRKQIPLPENLILDFLFSTKISQDGRWFIFPVSEGGTTAEGLHYAETWYLLDTLNGKKQLLNHSSLYGGNYQIPSFSPDGKWLVYYSGLMPTEDEFDIHGSYTVAMNLVRLSDGLTIKKINLLPPVFSDTLGGTYPSFLQGLFSRSWSPDNRYLAFSGATDGPSSDVYLYDTVQQTVTRLTDGPENIQWMEWSPDGKRILHASSLEYCEMITCENYYVVSIDGSPAEPIPDTLNSGGLFKEIGWLTPSKFAFYGLSNGPRPPVRYFDLDLKRTVEVFPDTPTSGGILDYETHTLIAFDADPSGLLWFNAVSGVRKKLELGCGQDCGVVDPIDFGPYRFSVSSREATFLLDQDGSSVRLNSGSEEAWSSPDGNGIAFSTRKPISIFLYGSDLKILKQISLTAENFWSLLWRPDSKGFFFQADEVLYYYDLSTDQFHVVDNGLSTIYQTPYPMNWVAE